MGKILGILALVAIGAILALASLQPDVFRVQRSATVNAPPETVFPLVDDFKAWTMESPSPLLGKVMHVFFDAEAMVGDDFARGLADLKALAEKPSS